MKHLPGALLSFVGLAGLFLFVVGCDIDSAESATRNVDITIRGFYRGIGGNPIVSKTSGAPVDTMDVRQNGDQLEAIDNHGIVFRGSIGQVLGTSASFVLKGRATSGQDVTISGNFNVGGTTSAMSGSWIEPTLVSRLVATATVPEANDPDDGDGSDTNAPIGSVSVSVTDSTLSVGGTTTARATGGVGEFTWDASGNLGNLNVSGDRNSTAAFTATGAGTVILTATATGGRNDSATITITESDGGDGSDENSDETGDSSGNLPPVP